MAQQCHHWGRAWSGLVSCKISIVDTLLIQRSSKVFVNQAFCTWHISPLESSLDTLTEAHSHIIEAWLRLLLLKLRWISATEAANQFTFWNGHPLYHTWYCGRCMYSNNSDSPEFRHYDYNMDTKYVSFSQLCCARDNKWSMRLLCA